MESLDSGHTTVKTENSQPGVFFEKGAELERSRFPKPRQYKSTLVPGFDFRIGLSFPSKQKRFRFPFLKKTNSKGYESRVGYESQIAIKTHIRLSYGLSYPTFLQRTAQPMTQEKNSCCDL
jgi:hypothetical protein